MKLHLRRRLVSPLIDLSYISMSFTFFGRASHWYERLNSWYYRQQAHAYDENVIEQEKERYSQALEAGLKAISVQPTKILDVNTGTGFVALRLRELFPTAQISATDLSEEMLKRAVSKAQEANASIDFVRTDVAHLPFASESFDLVALHNAPPNFIEMARVLRPGGQMLVAFTAGARLPRFLLQRLLEHVQSFGFTKIETGRAGDGLWMVMTRPFACLLEPAAPPKPPEQRPADRDHNP